MSFFNKLKKENKGGYIFLSHSHDDIAIVRQIRNILEEDGFEPLCFYLKCLDDDSEIEDLIKREIDAREWFVFVNSANSRKSKWVTLEREYISRTDRKKILTIDIDDESSIIDVVQKIRHNLRVFISCSAKDVILARKIKSKLEDKDYLVFLAPDSIPAGSSYASVISNAIVEASQEGCVIAIITSESVKSLWVERELGLAISKNGNIIPVMVGNVHLSETMKFYLNKNQFYNLSENPSEKEIETMIDTIGVCITK